jgi:PAS domain S-box-containing protein
MSPSAYLLLGLTAIVGALAGLLVFAVLRFAAAARDAGRRFRPEGTETAFLTAALEEAVTRLRERERATQARAEASERLSSEIIASLASGLLVVGVGGEVRILNPAARRLLGLDDAPAAGSFRDLLAPTAAPLAQAIDECLATRRPIVRRALHLGELGRPGTAAYLGVTVSPILDEAGTLHGAICLFTDLSAVVELEEQLRLKDSLARLGELTAGLAHELRNGLATIHGYARLLDPERLPPPYASYVAGIRQETEALSGIVENFLNFARPARLTVQRVDLGMLARRVGDELAREVEARGGSFRLEGDFAAVDGDEVLLRQAFSNLCRNALEACTEAGIVPEILVEGSIDPDQQVARVAVCDNGPGVDPTLRDRIFHPFFTTRTKGTGLGLALVQKIVVTHNGRVTVGSSDLGGARFLVTLPLALTA